MDLSEPGLAKRVASTDATQVLRRAYLRRLRTGWLREHFEVVDFAQRAGRNPDAIEAWLAGTKKLSLEDLAVLLGALEFDLELVGRDAAAPSSGEGRE